MSSRALSLELLQATIEVQCPRCEFGFEVELVDAYCQTYRWCPCCRALIHLVEPAGEVHGAIEEIDSAMRGLQRQLKGMFR